MASQVQGADLDPGGGPVQQFRGVPEASERGRLQVGETAVRHMAEHAAAEVTGRTEPTGIGGFGGRSLPRATVKVIGRHARIEVHVSVPGGRSLPEWAQLVRQHVTHRVGALSGLTIDVADVRVVGMSGAPAVAENGTRMAAAARPAGPGPARFAGVVLALVVVAAGVVAGYDALAGLDVIGGGTVTDAVLDWLDGLRPATWMLAAGIGTALIGLWFVLAGLWRRPRRTLPVIVRPLSAEGDAEPAGADRRSAPATTVALASADAGVYVSRSAVEGLATDTASRHPGVLRVRAKARGKAVVVRVDTDGEATAENEVRTSVRARIARLGGAYDVRGAVRRVPGRRRGGRP